MERTEWLCPICGDVRSFEQPPCNDGHVDAGDCPEWACVDCGTAFLLGESAAVTGTLLHRAA